MRVIKQDTHKRGKYYIRNKRDLSYLRLTFYVRESFVTVAEYLKTNLKDCIVIICVKNTQEWLITQAPGV